MKTLALSALLAITRISGAEECRNPLVAPFNASSIWNVPLGEDAVFAAANLFTNTSDMPSLFIDEDYFVKTAPTDPLTVWRSQGHWNATPDCELFPWAPVVGSVPWPANLTITQSGNNALALLLPDGDTLVLTQPAYKCAPTAPLLSLFDRSHGRTSIRGAGNWGGHGGSSLNAIGGSLRLGELLPSSPAPGPQHVLKIQLWAKRYYFGSAFGANWSSCFRWPALNCDGYGMDPSLYGGANPKLTPGALLAVPLAQLPALVARLATPPARALAWTFAHYGGLLCDDTYADRATFNAEHGFDASFEAAWGWPFVTWQGDARPGAKEWLQDVLTLWRALSIVDSNTRETPGGGGAPLQPPLPPLCPA